MSGSFPSLGSRFKGSACALAWAVLVSLQSPTAAAATAQMRLSAHEQALGRADAPLAIVEFTDYQCPYCRAFQASTWPLLKRTYIDTGKVRFVVRDFPLKVHQHAGPAAEAAHCAARQGKFWLMHNALLSDMRLDEQSIFARAEELGLDATSLGTCLAHHLYAAAIARNASEAAALGVTGTPTFIIGRIRHGELTGVRVPGALSYDSLATYLDSLLSRR